MFLQCALKMSAKIIDHPFRHDSDETLEAATGYLLRLGESLLCEEQFKTASFVPKLTKSYTLTGLSPPTRVITSVSLSLTDDDLQLDSLCGTQHSQGSRSTKCPLKIRHHSRYVCALHSLAICSIHWRSPAGLNWISRRVSVMEQVARLRSFLLAAVALRAIDLQRRPRVTEAIKIHALDDMLNVNRPAVR